MCHFPPSVLQFRGPKLARILPTFPGGLEVAGLEDPEFLRAVLDSLLTGVYLVDSNGKVTLWNAGAERITGHLRHDVVGHTSPADILVTADVQDNELIGEAAPLAIALREGKPNTMQVSLLHRAGHRVPARLHTVPLRDSQNVIIGAVESFSEFVSGDDIHRRQSKLGQYGCLDRVSGVLNHSLVRAHLREALATFTEHPVPFSIICIGIDGLDKIRARHGQGAIASVLRVVGQTIENSLRPTDFIGRWMENEFLTILAECNEAEVKSVGQRVRRMVLQSKVEWWGDSLPLTLSMGATSALPGDTSESMVLRAENGLRESFSQGGNRLVSCSA
jgi:diguanylate cyclase (GGDEF)-like protein/PAS domain S-box-containing protein